VGCRPIHHRVVAGLELPLGDSVNIHEIHRNMRVGGLRNRFLRLVMLRGGGEGEEVKMESVIRARPKVEEWCGLTGSVHVACVWEPR
jgi:hypothetical protein